MEAETEFMNEEIAEDGVSSETNVPRGADGSIVLPGFKEEEATEKEEVTKPVEPVVKEPVTEETVSNLVVDDSKQDSVDNTGMISQEDFSTFQGNKDKETAAANKRAEDAEKKAEYYAELVNKRDAVVDTEPVINQAINAPTLPTEDDFLDDPVEATDRMLEHKLFMRDQEASKARSSKETADKETWYKTEHEKDAFMVGTRYPDIKKTDSALYKKSLEILNRDSEITKSPYYESYIISQAALELGILPSKQANTVENLKKTQQQINKNKKGYIVGNKTNVSKNTTESVDTEAFGKMNHAEQDKHIKALFDQTQGG